MIKILPYHEFVELHTTEKYDDILIRKDMPLGNISYACLGLAGEAGEFIDHVKKLWRGNKFDPLDMALELGDTQYYAYRLAKALGYTMDEVLVMNQAKLNYRVEYGKDSKGEYKAASEALIRLRASPYANWPVS